MIATVAVPASAPAQYVTDHNLRAFLTSGTLHGETVLDRETWHVVFSRDGTFYEKNDRARLPRRGNWSVAGHRITLLYQRGAGECRSLLLATDGRQVWQDCDSGRVSSCIVSPVFDRSGPDRNAEMARSLEAAGQMMRGFTQGLPPGHPARQMTDLMVDGLLTPEARRLLSPQGRLRHAAAVLESFDSGRPSRWSLPETGEQAAYEPLGDFTNSRGEKCRRVRSDLEVAGKGPVSETVTYCRRADGSTYAVV
jgi:hypothetical protein